MNSPYGFKLTRFSRLKPRKKESSASLVALKVRPPRKLGNLISEFRTTRKFSLFARFRAAVIG
jgi:hypothetical protein